MLNSVELVLMFLSMFPSLTQGNINAVGFLLGLSCQYDMLDLMFMIVNYGIGGLAMDHIDTLFALAESSGFDTEGMNKHDMTNEDLCEMLHSIVKPILGQMEPSEMALLRQTQASGEEVLKLPLSDLETLVKSWMRSVREDDEKHDRFGKLAEAVHAKNASKKMENKKIDTMNKASVPGSDDRSKDEKMDAWSNMKMDDKTAAAIVKYCHEYAAAPLDTKLARTGRVDKARTCGKRGPNGLWSLDSSTTNSSGVCIGFSMSWRTITSIKPRKVDSGSRKVESAGSSSHPGDWSETPIQSIDGADSVDASWTTHTGSSTAYDDEIAESNTSQDLPHSMSISTWEAKWQHRVNQPPLVGYYMRWEMHVTKHGLPRRSPATTNEIPKSPIPGMTIEQVYESYADRWDVEQNQLWRDALCDQMKDYNEEDMDSEYKQETKIEETVVETKRGVVARAVEAMRSGIRGLFKA